MDNSLNKKTPSMVAGFLTAIILVLSFIFTRNMIFGEDNNVDPFLPVDIVTPADKEPDPYSQKPQDEIVQEPEEETVIEKYVKITKAVNVTKGESSSSEKLGNLKAEVEVKYISESDNGYQVRYAAGKNGWISKDCGEVIEKEVTYKHIPKEITGEPIDIGLTKYADDLYMAFANRKTVGGSVAVIKNGKVCLHYEYGYADKEPKNEKDKVKVAENTKFRIASVSKVFAAMMSMRAVDDGILDIDADLSKVMKTKVRNPAYPNIAVTQRMLLTHTAGMRDANPIFTGAISTQLANSRNYNRKPGGKFLYSNFGMGVAGAVIEKSSNQVISEYARDKFFGPMGLDASFDAKYLSDKSLVANCYNGGTLSKDNKYLTRSQPWGGPGQTYHLTAGGLLISSEDLATLMTLLINDGQYNGNTYLSQGSVNEILTVQLKTDDFDQCLAIRKKENLLGNRTMYYHNGEAYGIHSLIAFDPIDKSGVAIITSGASAVRNSNTIFAVCDEIMQVCYKDFID